MQTPSARQEFAIVVAVAVLGLVLVLVVAFSPWYPSQGATTPPPSVDQQAVRGETVSLPRA
jgi:hypothetical protein